MIAKVSIIILYILYYIYTLNITNDYRIVMSLQNSYYGYTLI